MPAQIFICCGGSGLETAARVNELLCEDVWWRERLDEEIYYIAVDTKATDLKRFIATVNAQAGDAKKPHVYPVLLSKNVTILQPLVEQYISQTTDPAARQRLLDHWWSVKDAQGVEEIFTARGVKNLTDGAGQCPPASFFLAWMALGNELKQKFDDLMVDIKRFLRPDAPTLATPTSGANLHVIAGLAGGTGRGCWELIAFRLRELLIQTKVQLSPYALLYDASVFKHEEEGSDRAVCMRVNSLTGVSQISAWIENIHRTDIYTDFRLPHLENARDDKMDLITFKTEIDKHRCAPVSNLLFIFDQGNRNVLASSQQYQQMGGAVLYGLVSESSINGHLVNFSARYGSVAAATFEVQASTIRQYLEKKLRAKVARWIGEGQDAGLADEALGKFLADTGLDFKLTADKLSELKPSAEGDTLQRICDALRRQFNASINGLKVALTKGNKDHALGFAKRLQLCEPGKEPERCPKELSDAIAQVLAGSAGATAGMKDPLKRASALAVELVKKAGSASVAVQFLDRVCTRLKQELAELPPPEKIKLEARVDPLELIKQFAPREWIFVGECYNKHERAEIEGSLPMAIAYWNYGLIHRELNKKVELWIKEIGELQLRFNTVAQAGKDLASRFEKQIQQFFVEQKHIENVDPHSSVFSDPERPDLHVPDPENMRNFFRRDLYPAFTREEVEALLPNPEVSDKACKQQIDAALRERTRGEDESDVAYSLQGPLETEILDNNSLPFDLVRTHFSIVTVLEKMMPGWKALLKKKRGNKDEYNRLSEKFNGFFGQLPGDDQGQPQLPGITELLKSMCASLALSCQAFWRIRGAIPLKHEVMVFPPSKLRSDSELITEGVRKLAGDHVKIQFPAADVRADGSVGNPFVLFAFSYEGVDDIEKIESLDYWKTQPKVTTWLKRCEDPSGSSMFIREQGNNGIGFPDPSFVRDPKLAAMRWRPWYKQEEAQANEAEAAKKFQAEQQRVENEALDAALYALLDPKDSVKAALARRVKGWAMPLLAEKKDGALYFTRHTYRWTDGKLYKDTGCGWRTGRGLFTGISDLVCTLKGEASKQVDGESGRAWRGCVIAESVLFWDEAATRAKIARGPKGMRAVLETHRERLGGQKANAREESDKACWQKLICRLDEHLKK